MVSLSQLWLPILLAAVVVHLAGFVMWMAMPHHRNDWSRLPNEDGILGALRSAGVGAGQYNFPHPPTREAMKDPAFIAKCEAGPMGHLIMAAPGKWNMNRQLVRYFLYTLAISFTVGYLASRTLESGAEYLAVFRVVGVAATLAYVGALPPASIWFNRTWGSIRREMFDGLVYGLLTAGVFGWLWPQ
ncbi:MAG TPA: hypothetical protein VFO06_03230 [Gemmatimonadales bacterium]|nr:hypothetical protein [Gemmatimonadales bacterium]